MIFNIIFFYIGLNIKYINCRNDHTYKQREFIKLEKLYSTPILCENLSPESVTLDTVCLSPCSEFYKNEYVKCNSQAETWKIRLKVDRSTSFFDTTGCKQGQRRFRCIPYKTNEGECDDETSLVYQKGYSCFTKCGVKTCPSESFKKPNDEEDLKIADCTSGFRVRCSFNDSEEGREIGTGNLTVELKTKSHRV